MLPELSERLCEMGKPKPHHVPGHIPASSLHPVSHSQLFISTSKMEDFIWNRNCVLLHQQTAFISPYNLHLTLSTPLLILFFFLIILYHFLRGTCLPLVTAPCEYHYWCYFPFTWALRLCLHPIMLVAPFGGSGAPPQPGSDLVPWENLWPHLGLILSPRVEI